MEVHDLAIENRVFGVRAACFAAILEHIGDGQVYAPVFHAALDNADGNFVVKSTDKSDLGRFPKKLRDKVPSFFGSWKVTEKELILSNISGADQELVKELKVPFSKIDNQNIEIDGAKFKRGAA